MAGSAGKVPLLPAWSLSPLRSEGHGSPPPATPGALYRSCFAEECEAIALQLGRGGDCGQGRAVTVEAETLTPLEASCFFLGDPSQQAGLPVPLANLAPSSPRNRTFDASPSLGEAFGQWSPGDLAASRFEEEADAHRTFEKHRSFERLPEEAPVSFVMSTPVPSKGGFFPGDTPSEEQEGAEATRLPGSDSSKARLVLPKGSSGKKRPAGCQAAAEGASAPAAQGTQRKISRLVILARPETAGGAAAESQPPPDQKLPAEKDILSKLPCSRKPPLSTQPLSGPSRGPGLLTGLAQPGAGRVNQHPGTKLPVRAGRIEKPPCEVLPDTQQTPSATLLSRSTAPCSQCQQLAEENQRLRSRLENYERLLSSSTVKKQQEN